MRDTTVSETCVIAEEYSHVEAEARKKAQRYPLHGGTYYQVALELARIGLRHFAHCSTCQKIESGKHQVAA